MFYSQIAKTDATKDPRNVWENRYAVIDSPVNKIVGVYCYSEIISNPEFKQGCYIFRKYGQVYVGNSN